MSNQTQTVKVQTESVSVGPEIKILYASLFLILSTYGYDRLTTHYLESLVKTNRIGLWSVLVQYLEFGASLFLVVQLLLVLIFLWLGRNRIVVSPLRLEFTRLKLRHAAYGFAGGSAVVLAALPLILKFDSHSGLITLLTGGFYSIRSALIAAILLIALPILTEAVFREVIFGTLQKQLSTISGLIASSLLFAYAWPVYDGGTALLLGVSNCILYRISKNIIPGIISTIVATSSFSAILIILRLFHK